MTGKSALLLIGTAALGALVGPVVIAGVAAINTPAREGSIAPALALLDTLSSDDPTFRLNTTIAIDFSHIEEGGYRADQLPSSKPDPWFSLERIRAMEAQISTGVMREHQASHLSDQLSPFELEFYERCVRGTAFASFCAKKVRANLAPPVTGDPRWNGILSLAKESGR